MHFVFNKLHKKYFLPNYQNFEMSHKVNEMVFSRIDFVNS